IESLPSPNQSGQRVRSSMAGKNSEKYYSSHIHAQEEIPSHIIVVGFSARFGE
ncbi:hypothetical protein AVEN_68338-1, partial [Araneus ventricosus]